MVARKVYFTEEQVALGHADALRFKRDGTLDPDFATGIEYFSNDEIILPIDVIVKGKTIAELKAIESEARFKRLRERGYPFRLD